MSGGRGGHSGGDIALGRANAIKVLARALRGASELRIASLDGGASRNAIPRDASRAWSSSRPGTSSAARDAIADRRPAGGRRPTRHDRPGPCASRSQRRTCRRTAVDGRDERPHPRPRRCAARRARSRMSADFPGVVETSSSLGVAATRRRPADAPLPQPQRRTTPRCPTSRGAIAAAARLAGADAESRARYPGWRPDLGRAAARDRRGASTSGCSARRRTVTLTHGGLETALIAAKRPGLDMLSLRPADRRAARARRAAARRARPRASCGCWRALAGRAVALTNAREDAAGSARPPSSSPAAPTARRAPRRRPRARSPRRSRRPPRRPRTTPSPSRSTRLVVVGVDPAGPGPERGGQPRARRDAQRVARVLGRLARRRAPPRARAPSGPSRRPGAARRRRAASRRARR